MRFRDWGLLAALCFCVVGVANGEGEATAEISDTNAWLQIDAMPVEEALRELTEQTQLRFRFSLARNTGADQLPAPAIHGHYSYKAALKRLLSQSGLRYDVIGRDQVHIRRATKDENPGPAEETTVGTEPIHRYPDVADGRNNGVPEVLVHGNRLNADIGRTTDDVQPYIVIPRAEAERAQTDSVESLIKRHVPASLSANRGMRSGVARAGTSEIGFHGLSAREVVVLVNGRRLSAPFIAGAQAQADLNAIPVADIERVELLPLTASGIYGGGATGGVFNVVLRKDCERTRLMAGYGNTFESDASSRSVFLNHCFPFGEGERTTLRLSGSFAEESELLAKDRDFLARGRAQLLLDNPQLYTCSGLPPLGAQANIRDAAGLGLNGPGSPCFTSIPPGYTSADGPGPLLANAGSYNTDTPDTAQLNGGGHTVLRNGSSTRYVSAAFNHAFSRNVSAFVDFMGSRRVVRNPASIAEYLGLEGAFVTAGAPNNPLNRDIIVTAPAIGGDGTLENRLDSRVATGGIKFSLPRGYKFAMEYTTSAWTLGLSQPNANSAARDIAFGNLDILRDFNSEPLDFGALQSELFYSPLVSRSDALSLRWSLPLLELPAGRMTASGLVEHREEQFQGGTEFLRTGTAEPIPTSALTRQARRIDSAYVETLIPLLRSRGSASAAAAMKSRLDMQLALRVDRYRADSAQPRAPIGLEDAALRETTSFTSVNPTVGFRFQATDDVTLRMSFATGFLPASADELAPGAPRVFLPGDLRDPLRGDELTQLIHFRAGGNPSLRPERSTSWSAGFVWEPQAVPAVRVSVDYLWMSKEDDIVDPAELFFSHPARFEALYPGRITRSAPDDGDPYAVGRITAVNATAINISQARVEAVDASVAYGMRGLRAGDLTFSLRTTWQPTLKRRASPSSSAHNEAGIGGESLKFGSVAEVALKRGDWSFWWDVSFYGAYKAAGAGDPLLSEGNRDVRKQMYHDVSAAYDFGEFGERVGALTLQMSVRNVFNQRPPFDAGAAGYYSGFGDPRLATYSLSLTAQF